MLKMQKSNKVRGDGVPTRLRVDPLLPSQPKIFDPSLKDDFHKMNLLTKDKGIRIVDSYKAQLREFYEVQHPSRVNNGAFEKEFEKHLRTEKKPLWRSGRWVYYPWLRELVHILPEDEYFSVRTSRNNVLITREEQKLFYSASVGIVGLSVGSNIALALSLLGGAGRLKLADRDTLGLSNLNRTAFGIHSVGVPKVEATARSVFLINPYAKIKTFPEGMSALSIDEFLDGLTVVVDEFDNFPLKKLLRERAKKLHIPVISTTDVGENAVIDIERYDSDFSLELFNGRIPNLGAINTSVVGKEVTGSLIVQLVGDENLSSRMKAADKEMRRSIVSWPQLGSTALVGAAATAYAILEITLGKRLPNRAVLSLSKLFGT